MMEALSAFKFPLGKEARPLQPLSAERVNAARPPSSTLSITTKTTAHSEAETETESHYSAVESSPTRKAKANLFADYNPTNGTPPTSVTGFALPQSPSLPEINALRAHVRANSDVQGLVKRFEHLDVRDRDAENAERGKRHEAELRRAQIAREEAESDVKRLREELRRMKKEADEGRERERKVAKRLEVVMEEAGASKESHSSQFAVYEKELRRAKKEAFKSSSTVLKMQEELKSVRSFLRVAQSNLDTEKQMAQRKEQERFEMEYQLIPLQEQLEKLREKLRVVESEKEALKTNLQEEEVARIAAEGMIALPASQDRDEDLFSSPQKRAPSPLSDDKENVPVVAKKAVEIRRLAEELEREKMRREQAEEMAEFLKMECLFRCCSCKTARRVGDELVPALDSELASGVEKIREGMEEILTPPTAPTEEDKMEVEQVQVEEIIIDEVVQVNAEPAAEDHPSAPSAHLADQLDRSLTLTADSPRTYPSPDDQLREEAEAAFRAASPAPRKTSAAEKALTIPVHPSSPATPSLQETYQTTPFRQQPSIRTVTTTTTVPMHFTPISKPVFPNKPANEVDVEDVENYPPSAIDASAVTPTFDRAAALAAIEYRRGRAKSIANGHATPRKQMLEGVKERRDISAPALGQKVVGESVGKGGRSGSAGRGRK